MNRSEDRVLQMTLLLYRRSKHRSSAEFTYARHSQLSIVTILYHNLQKAVISPLVPRIVGSHARPSIRDAARIKCANRSVPGRGDRRTSAASSSDGRRSQHGLQLEDVVDGHLERLDLGEATTAVLQARRYRATESIQSRVEPVHATSFLVVRQGPAPLELGLREAPLASYAAGAPRYGGRRLQRAGGRLGVTVVGR